MKKMLRFLAFVCLGYFPLQLSSYELVVGSMFRDEAHYFKEWIEYHRMVGADHFLLYNDRSKDHWQEVLQPYIDEGLVEVFDWPGISAGDYTANQCRALRDALRRSVGLTKWFTFIDLDEFILPMQEGTVLECLDNHFGNAHAVYANWRCFGSGGVRVPLGDPFLFELTACSMKNHPRNCVGKTIVRPEYVDIDGIWYVHTCPLKEGGVYLNGEALPMPPAEGTMIRTDGFAHAKFIRINHYIMKDENYFQNVRLARAKSSFDGYAVSNVDVLLSDNKVFSLIRDTAMIQFIKKYHPEMAQKFWKQNPSKL